VASVNEPLTSVSTWPSGFTWVVVVLCIPTIAVGPMLGHVPVMVIASPGAPLVGETVNPGGVCAPLGSSPVAASARTIAATHTS